jgi:hypothetical protein
VIFSVAVIPLEFESPFYSTALITEKTFGPHDCGVLVGPLTFNLTQS